MKTEADKKQHCSRYEVSNYHEEARIPESDRLYLNVGGTVFITSRYALKRYPYTRLGILASVKEKEVHFDRNPKLMSYILDLYRTGELHVPRNCCSISMKSEMMFWDIPSELVSECCWSVFEEGDRNKAVIDDIDTTLKDPYEGIVGRHPICDHIWNTLSNPNYSFLLRSKLNIMDIFLLTVVWVIIILKEAVDFKVQMYGEIFFLTRVTINSFKAMRVLRIFNVLYRNEYTKVMILSLHASFHPLSLLMLAAMMAALLFGALVYLAELSGGSYDFRNVALAAWWGYDTMAAIGYGKIVPATLAGYIVAVCCGMFGVVLFSMPIAIMSESFQQYMVNLRAHRQRLAKNNYLRNQGKQNAFRSMSIFLTNSPSSSNSTTVITAPSLAPSSGRKSFLYW